MSINITLTKPAYDRLRKLKEPGESFSQMVLRELPERLETCGELGRLFCETWRPKSQSETGAGHVIRQAVAALSAASYDCGHERFCRTSGGSASGA